LKNAVLLWRYKSKTFLPPSFYIDQSVKSCKVKLKTTWRSIAAEKKINGVLLGQQTGLSERQPLVCFVHSPTTASSNLLACSLPENAFSSKS